MAKYSIHEHLHSINNHVALEHLLGTLAQAQALSEVCVTMPDFMAQDKNTIYHYLWALNGLVIQAKQCCDKLTTGK